MTLPLLKLQRAAHLSNLAVNHFDNKDFIPAVGKLSIALGEVKLLIKEMEDIPSSALASSDGVAVCVLYRRLCDRPGLTKDAREERHQVHPSSSASRRSYESTSGEQFHGSPTHPATSSCRDIAKFAVHHNDFCGDDLPASWDPYQPFATEGYPFIYDIPFHISEESLVLRSLDHNLLSEISVAILFNLALCHHMRVVHYRTCILRSEPNQFREAQEEDTATIRLVFQQALLLYGLAYEVQLHKHFELSPECTMALANNMGLIHQEMGDTTKASRCFSRLLSTLLYIGSNASTNSEHYGYEGDPHSSEASQLFTEGFIHSVSHLILKKQAAEAA